MDFLAIFRAPGWIFGPPAMLLALAAVALCAWASVWPSRAAARRALICALSPLVVAVIGILASLVYWLVTGNFGALSDPRGHWLLGDMLIFGLVLSALPTLWAALLLRRRRNVLG